MVGILYASGLSLSRCQWMDRKKAHPSGTIKPLGSMAEGWRSGGFVASERGRCAFRGHDSIEHKARLQGAIDDAAMRYGKPVVVLYFGDDDAEGWKITQVVERDIRSWTDTPFEWVRVGLNEGQGADLGIPGEPREARDVPVGSAGR